MKRRLLCFLLIISSMITVSLYAEPPTGKVLFRIIGKYYDSECKIGLLCSNAITVELSDGTKAVFILSDPNAYKAFNTYFYWYTANVSEWIYKPSFPTGEFDEFRHIYEKLEWDGFSKKYVKVTKDEIIKKPRYWRLEYYLYYYPVIEMVDNQERTISVSTEPEGADIYFFNIYGKKKISPCEIKIKGVWDITVIAKKEGYETKTNFIRTTDVKDYDIHIDMGKYDMDARNIKVDTYPTKKAKIYFEDKYLGLSPLEFSVNGRTIGYFDIIKNGITNSVFLNAIKKNDQSLQIKFDAEPRALQIKDCDPAVIKVEIDGSKSTLATPFEKTFYGSNHTVCFSAEGYHTQAYSMVDSLSLSLKLVPIENANLNIFSNPSDAGVYINGKYFGQTPLKNIELFPNYTTISLKKDKFRPWETNINLKELRIYTYNANLRPKASSLLQIGLVRGEIGLLYLNAPIISLDYFAYNQSLGLGFGIGTSIVEIGGYVGIAPFGVMPYANVFPLRLSLVFNAMTMAVQAKICWNGSFQSMDLSFLTLSTSGNEWCFKTGLILNPKMLSLYVGYYFDFGATMILD